MVLHHCAELPLMPYLESPNENFNNMMNDESLIQVCLTPFLLASSMTKI
jgi:hypothetical protein